jgi:predicted nucleic acid-binding protein
MKDKYIDQYGIDSLPNLKIAKLVGCKAFITINQGMLKDRKELERKFKIKIMTPEEFIKESKEKRKND